MNILRAETVLLILYFEKITIYLFKKLPWFSWVKILSSDFLFPTLETILVLYKTKETLKKSIFSPECISYREKTDMSE